MWLTSPCICTEPRPKASLTSPTDPAAEKISKVCPPDSVFLIQSQNECESSPPHHLGPCFPVGLPDVCCVRALGLVLHPVQALK